MTTWIYSGPLILLLLAGNISRGLTIPGPAGAIGGPVNICKPASGIVYSTDSIPHATGYFWTLPIGVKITNDSNTNHITVSFTEEAVSGNISVYGTNLSGNGSSSNLTITVSPYPSVPTITPPGPLALCPGSVVNLSVTPQSGSTYCWYSTDQSQMKSWQYLSDPGFSSATVDYVSSVFSPTGQLYVAFQDYAHSYQVSVMKFDGTNWQYVGSPGFSAGTTTYPTLAFSPSGQLYIGFQYNSTGSKVKVMKFDGTTWVNVGLSNLLGKGDYPSLAFNRPGLPYLAFKDADNQSEVSVKRYLGTAWEYAGPPGFSNTGNATYESLAFDSSGHPYVAYEDLGNGSKATVMKFNGTNWVYVGSPGFSSDYAVTTNLAFSPSGQPFVSYGELINGHFRPSVMRFNGTIWDYIGSPGFSSNDVCYVSLAFNPYGQPCVAYEDYAYSTKATVKMFDGNDWVPVGLQGFSSGESRCTSLTFSPSGEPYVAFEDLGHDGKSSVMHYSLSCLGNLQDFTVNTPGTYAMTIANQAGCTVTSSNQVTVNPGTLPTPEITGDSFVCNNSGLNSYYTEEEMTDYTWTVSGGGNIIDGYGTNAVQVDWELTGAQWIAVSYANVSGCTPINPTQLNVTVNPIPSPAGAISGDDSGVCQGVSAVVYSVVPVENASGYTWTVPPGAYITGDSNSFSVTVNYSLTSTSGTITVLGTNSCGNGGISPDFPVSVYPVPPAPIITVIGDMWLHSNITTGNQWYFNDKLLNGETKQDYLPTLTGEYWDVVTWDSCISDTSNHINIVIERLEDLSTSLKFNIFPSPNDGRFTASISGPYHESLSIRVYNDLGMMLYEIPDIELNGRTERVMNLGPVPEGIYSVLLRNNSGKIVKKIIVNR